MKINEAWRGALAAITGIALSLAAPAFADTSLTVGKANATSDASVYQTMQGSVLVGQMPR